MTVAKQLNQQVANLSVLYVKLHNFHWFVKGESFFQLHEKFEELYDETTEIYDEVAERMLMIGEKPVGTLKGALELATIKEATGKETTKEMIESLIHDYKLLNDEFGHAIPVAESTNDDVTVDLLTSNRAVFQKHIWMLQELLK